MTAPVTADEFLDLVRGSGVTDDKRLIAYLEELRRTGPLPEPNKVAGFLVRDGILTHFQAEQILQGKWRRFSIGRYKVLERVGAGLAGSLYLCEDPTLRRPIAVKVLPTGRNNDPLAVARFYRECEILAALDHPNIVRAYEVGEDGTLRYLGMEYVDGSSLEQIVEKCGPMDVTRAAHYIRQAALGLQHVYLRGVVHRDIKPADILLDRHGAVKIIDFGLARIVEDGPDFTAGRYEGDVLGTPDYTAPEQAINPDMADIRADIYSLGCTFQFCLTGRTPFPDGTVAQKVIWHQVGEPEPIRRLLREGSKRPALAALIKRMMAKDPAQRPQTPQDVAEALTTLSETPIAPPPEDEMPQHSPAVRAVLGL
jgi:serine/threonine protein kinase